MNNLFMMNIGDFLPIFEEAIELAKFRGKKEGENIEPEFFEIMKKHNKQDTMRHLGKTELDKDLLLGNLREEGIKITTIEELKRRGNGKDK